MRRLIEQLSGDGDIILDFFAGSASLASGVMLQSEIDESRRRWIMVQLPEPCTEGSEAFKAGFRTIAEIGKERIRRASRKIADAGGNQLDINRNANLDLGFKTFKLDRSNFRLWNGNLASDEELGWQIDMHVDHLAPTSTADDVLYELLLKAGFSLATNVQIIELAGKQVFSVEDGALLICLEKEITAELIDALAEANPLQVICLDEAFKGNDQLKANAVQTFKARARTEESEIVFRTV
jgi:adenine-specific DNA-methyltransferase